MYFQMIPPVNKFLDDQQSIELGRIRTTSFNVYLYDMTVYLYDKTLKFTKHV